jgi:hypothetical protein
MIFNCLLPFNLSTTRRTSPEHHLPFGFLLAQSQPPAFFSETIFSRITDRPFLIKSCSISFAVYPKQYWIFFVILDELRYVYQRVDLRKPLSWGKVGFHQGYFN